MDYATLHKLVYKQYTTYDLISVIFKGILERKKKLINSFLRSCSEYIYGLLRYTVKVNDTVNGTISKLLLISGSKVNSENKEPSNTPLHFAVKNDNEEITKLLLSRGANVDAENKNGVTPLHIATYRKNLRIVELLLNHGAYVNCAYTSRMRDTPLNFIVQLDFEESFAKEFLEDGTNFNNKNYLTPLLLAAETNSVEIVEVLLKFHADIDFKDQAGRTALHIASEKGYKKVVEVLLKFGADIDSKDQYGITALHIVCKRGNINIISIFLEYCPDIGCPGNDYIPFELAVNCTQITLFDNNGYNNWDSYNSDDFDDFYDSGNENLYHNFSYSPYDTSYYEKIIKMFYRYTLKIKTANLYVSEKYLLLLSQYWEKIARIKREHPISIERENVISTRGNEISGIEFQNVCKKEIANMKNEKVNNANVSFYDILTADINQLAVYARNKGIVQVLRSDDYKIKFPIYANMINSNFIKGERRKELLEHSNKIFHFFFNNFKLPQECTEKICSYLSNADLRNLMDVY